MENEESLDMPAPMEEGMAPTSPQPLPEAGISQDAMTVRANLAEHLNNLPEEAKQFVQAFITPEQVMFLRVVFGQEVGDFFQQFENPEVILIPMERAEVQNVFQGQGQQPQQSQTTPPMTASAPSAGATSEMMPPPMA